LANEIENPSLDYPELENFDFDQREQGLLQLKKDILMQEQNSILKQIYQWRINEKIAEVRMLKAAHSGDDKRFVRYSKFIYGQPEKEIYEYTISQVKEIIDKKIFDADTDISAAAKRLNAELFEALLNNETTITRQNLDLPKERVSRNERIYSSEEIKDAFDEYLKKFELEGWKIIVDKEGKFSSINVSQQKRTVNIPEARKLDHSSLLALIEHELGTHVARREKGERSKLKLLGLGLDRYLKGEEGTATYAEQKIRGLENFAGFGLHLAASLALGLDGKKRDFRKVFEILKDVQFIGSKKEKSSALASAQNEAWNICIRIFRGTSCKTLGACFTKDIVYREGNIGVWSVVKTDPAEERRFSVGKYDPANSRHLYILNQIGINDSDLENLEK
jgi:hypothetical protein